MMVFGETLSWETGIHPCAQRPLETPRSSDWLPLKGKHGGLDNGALFSSDASQT